MLKQKRYTAVVLLVLALIATVFYLFPLVLVLTNSLKTTGEFTSNPFSLPTVLQWGNYSYAFEQMHFLTSLRNSLVITVCVCALIALLGAMAAYAVSRVRHKFVSTIYYLMLASMCAPFQAYMIPLVKIYASQLGLTNSLIPVIYIGLGLNICFSIFLVRGFLNSIPREIDEAALIDGASPWQRFAHVTLPLLMPAIRINVVTNIIGSLSVFDVIMSLTEGGPGYSTESLSIYIMRMCYGSRTGYSTAVAMILFLIILIPVLISMRLTRAKD